MKRRTKKSKGRGGVRSNPRGAKFWESQFRDRVARDGDAARTALRVDPALWRVEARFGVAGGRFVHRLTTTGLDRAAAVAGIPSGTFAILSRVVALGGSMDVEERIGSRMHLLVTGAELASLRSLVGAGLLRWSDRMTRVDLTADGSRRLDDAHEEQARLLGRIRVAHPINRETGVEEKFR